MASPTWHREVLPPGWQPVAQALADAGALDGFALAGGTALALYFGHRRSVDLDLFTEQAFAPTTIVDRLRHAAGLSVIQTAPGTLHLSLQGVLVTYLHFPYPALFPTHTLAPLTVLDPRDVACMKLQAIAAGGARRDFVDLYVVAQEHGLQAILNWFDQKFSATPKT
ncbi:MAG: nucleotidyl transferase AbiEii/AbiGii toxin family protein, partial [Vicinamibacterales bacterium]